eukprot:CAMPEP_0176451336 /NCGR_PEP_ID=MMETSP0127-20121128/27768_1 /TAXON_ID=938130 /ORGANISM="Platyophrya macrostoma, Strain WH" /LENGTH=36 /DNA_ID= /DNA_START= /DNA_END= /DNA_ORIENTATION=
MSGGNVECCEARKVSLKGEHAGRNRLHLPFTSGCGG